MHGSVPQDSGFFFAFFPFCLCITNLSIQLVSPFNLIGVSVSALLLSQRFMSNIMIFVLPFSTFFNQGTDSYSFFPHCLCHLTPKSFRMIHSAIKCFSVPLFPPIAWAGTF